MKNLKAKQKAKGVKELSPQDAQKVTGGVWDNPNDPFGRQHRDPLEDLERTLGINEGPNQNPPWG